MYYGSFSSCTYLPISDIDIAVSIAGQDVNELKLLTAIAVQLFADGIIRHTAQLLPSSRIPLLKFHDSFTALPINITVNTTNVLQRAKFVQAHIRPKSLQLKLLYFIKYYLMHKEFNEVFSGGIGSYALSLMVILFFKKQGDAMVAECTAERRPKLLGDLLINFLRFETL